MRWKASYSAKICYQNSRLKKNRFFDPLTMACLLKASIYFLHQARRCRNDDREEDRRTYHGDELNSPLSLSGTPCSRHGPQYRTLYKQRSRNAQRAQNTAHIARYVFETFVKRFVRYPKCFPKNIET